MQVFLTANDAVVVFVLPERALAADHLVDFVGCETFPTMNRFAQVLPVIEPEENMDMVRHHDMGEEFVAGAVEVEQGVVDDFRDSGVGENAVAQTFVEECLHAGGEEFVKFLFVFGGEWLVAGGQPGVGFGFPIADELGGKAVGESPGDEVVFPVLLPVGEVAMADFDVLEFFEVGGR
jgi:hypothetical protein